ncbi:leucine-rich repeat-containing protein 75B [Erythrolamprus reginae]|uniref:leucine-rich repeat-containing protein 75B n=1 Tax=Erythrolamprus reginae TaxID=121349 RepID=UPI00396C7774
MGSSPAARRGHVPGTTERRPAGQRGASAGCIAPPEPRGLPGATVAVAMGSRLSRPGATGVAGGSLGSVRGRSRPEEEEEPPRRLGPDCRLASLLLRPGKLPAGRRAGAAAPYVRRVRWLREIQAALRQRQHDRALQLLRLLRKDLGLEGTFLNDVLYKKATFLNLVDPISHDLLMSLARDLQCPKKEYDPWKSSDRICRQLIYHLSPHSKRHRYGLPHRKPHGSLKSRLQKRLSPEALHLSGVPLSTRDLRHLARYLQEGGGECLLSIDLSFTGLKDEGLCFLMPSLRSLPSLIHLSLNGNHLTRATAKDLTEAMKDTAIFPALAWIDLGNNEDVSSMPQPLLVGLRKRLSRQTTLPTIYEALDGTPEAPSGPRTGLLLQEGVPPLASHCFHQQACER